MDAGRGCGGCGGVEGEGIGLGRKREASGV